MVRLALVYFVLVILRRCGALYLLDVDHDEGVNLRVLLFVEAAVGERHDDGVALYLLLRVFVEYSVRTVWYIICRALVTHMQSIL